jgi:Holliday junction resolvase
MGQETRNKARATTPHAVTTRSSRAVLTTKNDITTPNRTPTRLKDSNTPAKMSTRKSGNPSKSVTPIKSAKSKTPIKVKKNRVAQRTYFTVREDATILIAMKENPNDTFSSLSVILSFKMNHSSESIRDRIKRYLSKLTKRDDKVIIDANQVRIFGFLRPNGFFGRA